MTPLRGAIKKTYRCCVIEDGSQCDRHFDAFLTPQQAYELGTSNYLCDEHKSMGYSWLSEIMQGSSWGNDDTPTIDSIAHYENVGGQWKLVGDEMVGTRNSELYTRPKDFLVTKGLDLRPQEFTAKQQDTASKGEKVLRGWGVVQKFIDDTLMIPLDTTTDPENPTVKRKLKTIVGMAKAPPKSDDGVF